MTTIATIASDYDMQPRELATFLDLGHGYDEHEWLGEEEAQNIIDLIEYDLSVNS